MRRGRADANAGRWFKAELGRPHAPHPPRRVPVQILRPQCFISGLELVELLFNVLRARQGVVLQEGLAPVWRQIEILRQLRPRSFHFRLHFGSILLSRFPAWKSFITN